MAMGDVELCRAVCCVRRGSHVMDEIERVIMIRRLQHEEIRRAEACLPACWV